MFELLHSFAVGIAFSVGVVAGAMLCRIATTEGRKEMARETEARWKATEDRLAKYVLNTERIALAIESLKGNESND